MLKRNISEPISKISDACTKHPVVVIGVFCVVAFLFTLLKVDITLLTVFCLLLIISAGILLKIKGKLNYRNILILLFATGFFLRMLYVLYTGCMERQHDVEVFGSGHGHSGYIEFLYNEMRLPNFDVREVWQFYHPPLHHIICAAFLKVCTLFGIEYALSIECLQILTLFYSSVCMLISYRIIKELEIVGKTAILSFAIIAFHPTFIILSGSINNDVLSIAFQLGAILYTIRWYKRKNIYDIIKIALCIGLGMMTKLSAWMIAPAVAFVFIYSLINDLKSKAHKLSFYIKQYSVFGITCVPLGLWWSIRNYLMYAVPPNYIPLLGSDNPQYIGYHSIFKRFFDFGFHQFKSVFDMWGDPYFEYNPTIGLLKTAMFGESISDSKFPQISVVGTILFWLGTILAILGFLAMIYFLFSRKNKKSIFDIFLVLIYFVNLFMYYYFCIAFPFTCTQNIRYASPLILIGAIYIGKLLRVFNDNRKSLKIIKGFTSLLLVGFCLFSLVTYTLIGI